jgi:hypothetical protein
MHLLIVFCLCSDSHVLEKMYVCVFQLDKRCAYAHMMSEQACFAWVLCLVAIFVALIAHKP